MTTGLVFDVSSAALMVASHDPQLILLHPNTGGNREATKSCMQLAVIQF